jgi:predicted small secreted protein
MAKKLVAQALEVTQTVSNTQNVQRKKFLEHVKKQISNKVHVKKAWQQLIQQLTHERWVLVRHRALKLYVF